MKNLLHWLGIPVLAAVAALTVTAREETWEDQQQYEARNRINNYIKGLDAPYRLRQPYVQKLLAFADGKLRNLLLTQLIFGLNLNNDQITQGAIEIYTRISDPATIPVLKGELLYNKSLDVRRSVIVHLPEFYVVDAVKKREIMLFVEKSERYLPERLLAALREPPLENGHYSNVRDKLRREIESILVEQLEPVTAVMQGLETASYHKQAYEQLKNFLAVDLGHRKDKWREFWGGRGREFVSPLQSELSDTQGAACLALSAMGAEGTDELCTQIRWIMSTPFAAIRTAVLELSGSLMEQAEIESRGQRAALAKTIAHQGEKLWRHRRLEAAERLKQLIIELAEKYLTGEKNSQNLLLIDCLGQTRDSVAMPFLRRTLRSDNTSLETTVHVAGALGKIANPEAVRLLELMAEYQGIAEHREEQVQEYQRVRAAIRALAGVTGRFTGEGFIVDNQDAAKAAIDYIMAALKDSRQMAGAPHVGELQERTVASLVHHILRSAWRIDENSLSPAVWQAHYTRLTQNKTK